MNFRQLIVLALIASLTTFSLQSYGSWKLATLPNVPEDIAVMACDANVVVPQNSCQDTNLIKCELNKGDEVVRCSASGWFNGQKYTVNFAHGLYKDVHQGCKSGHAIHETECHEKTDAKAINDPQYAFLTLTNQNDAAGTCGSYERFGCLQPVTNGTSTNCTHTWNVPNTTHNITLTGSWSTPNEKECQKPQNPDQTPDCDGTTRSTPGCGPNDD